MKKCLLSFFALILLVQFSQAQPPQFGCDQQVKTKLILVGDSWASFSWIYKAYREGFRKFGHADKVEDGLRTTAIGAQAETFLDPAVAYKLNLSLQIHQDAEALIIFLGGNDVMSAWNSGETYENLDRKAAEVALQLDTIITNIRATRPDIRIIIASYDYPNFIETLTEWPDNPYYDFWEGLGFPTPLEANMALLHAEGNRKKWCDSIGVDYLNNIGLMQYVYGQKDPLPVWPYDPYPPRSVPFPEGDPRYPTPQEAMGLWGIDAYHLGPDGFAEIAYNFMREYMHGMMRGYPDNTTVSNPNDDGWVTENGKTGSGDVRIGVDKEGRPVRGVISFFTGAIPDNAVITHASMFFTRKRLVGGNPIQDDIFPSNTHIDIKSGSFGEPWIESGDYSAAADMEDAGCFVGHAWKNDYSIRVDFKPEALEFINKQGNTQMRLHFDQLVPGLDQMGVYYNGAEEEPYYAPYLDVFYTLDGVPTPTNPEKSPAAKLFPNPAGKYVTIEGISAQQAADMKVYNTLGMEMSLSYSSEGANKFRLNIPQWPAGTYFIQLPGMSGKTSFVKL